MREGNIMNTHSRSNTNTVKALLKRAVSLVLAAVLGAGLLGGCTEPAAPVSAALPESSETVTSADAVQPELNPNLDTTEDVTLIITGPLADFKAIESAAQKFGALYPNCHIEYEYLQDYRDTIEKRIANAPDSVDLFITDNIQADSPLYPYALELIGQSDKLDLSGTFDGLTNNFKLLGTDKNELYAVPLGGEVRGLFVNKTLLDSFGIPVPQNRTELFAACETFKSNNIIAFQGNPGSFSQLLLFPYITNIIASAENHDEVYKSINSCDESAAELFREPMNFMYTLTEKNYYNYKYVENEYGFFIDSDTDSNIKCFINITADGENEKKLDDLGKVPFMPGTISMQSQLDKLIDDYHSKIEYEFILSPVSDEGGFAYMSPARGIAVNKQSENTDWALEFMDFLFTEENNKAFAEEFNITPNTRDAVSYVANQFGIPESRVTQPADIAFDYGFYNLITKPLLNVSKANNPKYMNDDGSGNVTMYDFEHYMDELKARFAEQTAQAENGDNA